MRVFALLAVAAGACSRDAAAPPPAAVGSAEPAEHDLGALSAYEAQRRAAADWAALPPSDDTLGADPYRIAPLPGGGGGFVGLLRGDAALVALDRHGVETARVAAPRGTSGLAVAAAGDVYAVGEGERGIARYRGMVRVATLPVDALGLRDIALSADGQTAYVVEERDGRLLAVSTSGGGGSGGGGSGPRELGRCHGPIRVATLGDDIVAVDCLLDHTIEIHRGDAPVVRIQHDGPLWSFALARGADGALLVAAGGVEDHPLEREDGGFGYIDSYVFLYRVGVSAVRLATVNVSELDATTPKWLALRTGSDGSATVTTAGYASAQLVTVTWSSPGAAPAIARRDLLPGTAAATLADDGTLIAANPLFDGWVIAPSAPGAAPLVVPAPSARPQRPLESRLGELLFFTQLMAPWNRTEGKLSRFTCETCHFEGYVDGRTHYTGRADIHATTKPLHGLFNNRPYFSRALDKTMARMVDAEFRVANRHNDRDPWFALTAADVPWLAAVPGAPAELSPELLRTSLMAFLMDFAHRANPAAMDHAQLTPVERAGAAAFRDHCAACHAPRLVADDPQTAQPFERWEPLVLSPGGPLVWATADYAQTGVVPYVHASGTRVPSLRRLYKKWPYFTNGSAKSLDEVLARFATGSGSAARVFHAGAPADAAHLSAADIAALRAFLALL